MAADLEALLADLGRSWDAHLEPIDLAEVVNRRATETIVALAPSDSGDHGRSTRRGRRWMLASAAVVVAFVAGLALINSAETTEPVVTIIPTTTPTGTPTTVPTTAPRGSSVDAGTWWPVAGPVAECGPCRASTVRDDGSVLVVGGRDDGRSVIQVYDPASATFEIVAELREDIYFKDLVELQDGRLLITGYDGQVAIYDPTVQSLDLATGEFTTVSELAKWDRAEGPSVVVALAGGTVLVADHIGADLYDPATGTFTPFGHGGLGIIQALELRDGRLLLVRSDALSTTRSTEIYDPSDDTVVPVGSWWPSAELSDGRILSLEQDNTTYKIHDAAIHDLDSGEVTPIAVPTGRRFNVEPVVLDDDRVLIFGTYPGNVSAPYASDMTTAELFAFGDPGLPVGCCPSNPHLVLLAVTPPNDWDELIGRPSRLRVTVPAGGLSGATEASWRAWAAGESYDAGSDARPGDFSEGDGSVALPTECEAGCQFHLPLSFTPGSARQVGAELKVTYDGVPPDAANAITVTIDSLP
jgi:hypothetical protein